jgi:hypothetical protein
MSNPSFPVTTFAVWADEPVSAIQNQLLEKAYEMATQGKTDGVPEYDRLTPEIDVRRNWIDTSAANEWIAFVQGIGGPLTSITIL